MIHVQGLRKSFRDGEETHEVLGGVDLDIGAGDFVALIGRSGSGKSTLLHCLAGIERADSGNIRVDGVELAALSETGRTRLRRDRIGIVFQFFHLLPSLSVRDNIALPAHLRGEDFQTIRQRCDQLLEELEVLDRADQYPDRLSGGEQQRVAIARALVNSPALLLADEPTGNLDRDTSETTLELFRRIHENHGVTILMVTHSDEAAAIARRRARLVEGKVVWASEEPTPPKEVEDPDDTLGAAAAEPQAPPDPDAPKIRIPEGGSSEGVRPSAKAAALFGKSEAAAEDEPQPALDDVVDEALAEDLPEKSG